MTSRSLRRTVPVVFRLGLGLLLGTAVGSACVVESIFACAEDDNCIAEGGEGGMCEANNLCTFPDASCASGKRWYSRSGELADDCFDPSQLGGTGSGTGGSGSGESGSTGPGGVSTSQPGDSTGEPGTDDGPPATDDGASSSGGAGATCDEIFGGVPDYELCNETSDSCRFNVTLNMSSCADLCAMFGSMMCVTAFANDASDCASQNAEVACTEVANDNICECAK